MTTRHLGKRLCLLLDSRLDRDETLRAMAHLDECEACSEEWESLRRDREALQTSGTGIDMRFAQRLLDKERIAEIALAEPKRHAKAATGAHPHVLRATVLSASGVVGILAILYILGQPKEIPLETFLYGSQYSGLAIGTSAAPAMTSVPDMEAWAHPVWDAPVDAQVEAVVFTDGSGRILSATMVVAAEEFTVTERKGQLPADVSNVLERTGTESRDVFLLEGDGTSVLFESGNKVVKIDCACPVEDLVGFADTFPEGRAPGVLERLGEGVGVFADAVTGD